MQVGSAQVSPRPSLVDHLPDQPPLLTELRAFVQLCPAQVRTAQIRATEIRPAQVGALEVGFTEIHAPEKRTPQISVAQVASRATAVGELPHHPPPLVNAGALVEHGTTQVDGRQVRAIEPGTR